jgi:hypothetical protein
LDFFLRGDPWVGVAVVCVVVVVVVRVEAVVEGMAEECEGMVGAGDVVGAVCC